LKIQALIKLARQAFLRDWTRNEGITVTQLDTGHSSLLVAYLQRMTRLGHLSVLQWRWIDGGAPGLAVPVGTWPGSQGDVAGPQNISQYTMPVELPREDWGADLPQTFPPPKKNIILLSVMVLC